MYLLALLANTGSAQNITAPRYSYEWACRTDTRRNGTWAVAKNKNTRLYGPRLVFWRVFGLSLLGGALVSAHGRF